MRTLSFQPTENRRYKIIHQTLIFSPVELTRDDLLTHGRMLELVKGIGERDARSLPTDENPDPQPIFNIQEDGGVVTLDEAMFALLRKHFKGTISKFPKEWSLEVMATDEWLKGIKEEQVPQKKKAEEVVEKIAEDVAAERQA